MYIIIMIMVLKIKCSLKFLVESALAEDLNFCRLAETFEEGIPSSSGDFNPRQFW